MIEGTNKTRAGPIVMALMLIFLAGPLAHAQHPGQTYRVGLVFVASSISQMAGPEPVHPSVRAFLHEMRRRGYVEGRNFVFEARSAEGQSDRLDDLLADLLRLKMDVIVTAGNDLPNGHIFAPYYILEFPPRVNVVALTRDHHVVLVPQYRHGIQRTEVELPCGRVEATEVSPLAAVQRELLEETGYAGTRVVETGRLSANPANHANWTYCFLATGAERVAAPMADDREHVETVLMLLAGVVELACHSSLVQALHVGSLFFALHALGQLELQW